MWIKQNMLFTSRKMSNNFPFSVFEDVEWCHENNMKRSH